jgi:hypothetical protein
LLGTGCPFFSLFVAALPFTRVAYFEAPCQCSGIVSML